DQRRPHAGGKHPVPAMWRLLPKMRVEFAVIPLVTAPGVVDQQIELALLLSHAGEEILHIRIELVVAADSDAETPARRHSLGRLVNRAGQVFRSRRAAHTPPGDVDDPAPCTKARGN